MQIVNGDITTVQSGHVIHGCNTGGVMGAGVALAIRNKWPQAYNIYKHKHDHYGLIMGSVIPVYVKPNLVVWNMITQNSVTRDGSRVVSYAAIENCLGNIENIVDKYYGMFYGVPNDLHFPKIGAGLGGGDWDIIKPIIESRSSKFELTLWEYGNDN